MLAKSSFREIKETIGRYIALVLIIALGVGFFSGLKVTDPAMRQAMQQYFKDTSFYDYRLISTLGFEEEDVEYVAENVSARAVEGSVSFDVLADYADSSHAIKAISIPTNVNTIVLESGRLPENDDECLVDSYLFNESTIGNTIKISSNNEKDDSDNFKYSQYTIVGTVKSPLYIQYERGSTTLGSGVLDGYIYINKGGFDVEYYTDIYVKLDSDLEIYSDEYKDLIDGKEDEVQKALDEAANNRYDRIIADAYDELNDAKEEFETSKEDGATELADAKEELDSAKKQLDSAKAQIEEYEAQESQLKSMLDLLLLDPTQQEAAEELSVQLYTLQVGLETAKTEYANGLAEYNEGLAEYEEGLEEYNTKIADAEAEIADAEAEIEDIEEANTYLLTRDSNVGYVCFESDSTIVGAIANVFPVFFFLVAALVFMTTMNRMVEDQRTQIGVLKALGYSNGSIMGKFVFYSGSAAFIGTALGFVAGTIAFPKAIWFAYKMMYNTSEITYFFSPAMLLISFVVAFICSVGVTFISCRYEMGEMAASLMRPKAPKAGKRIFLEYLPWFWNRLKFLKKVSLRNIFRYKGRLFMMVLGIGGCTALLVAGFGIYDSIADIAVNQFTNISKYDIDITLKDGATDTVAPLENMGYTVDDYLLYYHTSVDLKVGS